MRSRKHAYLHGAKDAFPSVIGLIPFGLIVGTASTAAGMDPWLALAMSIIVFAGASQLAAIALMVQSAPMLIVVLTVLVVNLRFVMYSASLAPFFRELPVGRRWLLSYALTDHLFALVNARFKRDGSHQNVDAYYIGAAIPTCLTWHVMVAIGIFAGTLVPRDWSLDFAIPLVFLALVFPALTSRAHWLTAAVAGVAAFYTVALPLKLGLIAAAFTGVLVGSWADAREAKRHVKTG